MPTGLSISLVWFDEHVHEYKIQSSNDFFSGETNIYSSYEEVIELAKSIKGFPKDISDTRSFELGTFDPSLAGGGVKLVFRCVDAVGHISVETHIKSGEASKFDFSESASLIIPTEPAAIDRFMNSILNSQSSSVGDVAYLKMIE